MTPETKRLLESRVVLDTTPDVREWLKTLLLEGESADSLTNTSPHAVSNSSTTNHTALTKTDQRGNQHER